MNKNGYKINYNPWKRAKKLSLIRNSPCGLYDRKVLDKGVNYFILALESLDCVTEYSCEGHFKRKNYTPQFYISFIVPNSIVLEKIKQVLIKPCTLYHEHSNTYTLRIDFKNPEHKVKILTKLSRLWEKYLFSLKK